MGGMNTNEVVRSGSRTDAKTIAAKRVHCRLNSSKASHRVVSPCLASASFPSTPRSTPGASQAPPRACRRRSNGQVPPPTRTLLAAAPKVHRRACGEWCTLRVRFHSSLRSPLLGPSQGRRVMSRIDGTPSAPSSCPQLLVVVTPSGLCPTHFVDMFSHSPRRI